MVSEIESDCLTDVQEALDQAEVRQRESGDDTVGQLLQLQAQREILSQLARLAGLLLGGSMVGKDPRIPKL